MTKTFGIQDASFIAAGGIEGINQLVADFYALMSELPQARKIRAMHPENIEQSVDKLARFLSGWLGGPRLYQEKYGSISIPGVHSHLHISKAETEAWLKCMQLAIDKQNYSPEFSDYLIAQLRIPAMRIQQVCERQRFENS